MPVHAISNIFAKTYKTSFPQHNSKVNPNIVSSESAGFASGFGRICGVSPLAADTISFTGKNYGKDSIMNPTDHCAYCGVKIYNEQQIDGIAKEILASKAERLEGKIRSVLEKLSEAKNAPDLASAKQSENAEHIDFFKNISNISSKRPYTKGEELFKDVFALDHDEAVETLKKHLKPLLSTVDHVMPQNMDKSNDNSDINLVESCYCCNHDIKNGTPFIEFYTMFPSVERNMPKDKFIYAASEVLDSAQESIEKRLSSASLMKLTDNLFTQKKEIENNLSAVKHRLKECDDGISAQIDSYMEQSVEDSKTIERLQKRLEEREEDPEFCALLRRNELNKKIASMESVRTNALHKIGNLNSKIYMINNPKRSNRAKKKGQQPKPELSQEEKAYRISLLEAQILPAQEKADEADEKIMLLQEELDKLNEEYPEISVYSKKKSELTEIANAYETIKTEMRESELLSYSYKQAEIREKELSKKIENCSVTVFDINSYSEEEREEYKQYLLIKETLQFIDDHPCRNPLKQIINDTAKAQLEKDSEQYIFSKPVVDSKIHEEYVKDRDELKKAIENKEELKHKLQNSQKIIERSKKITEGTSLDDINAQIEVLSKKIEELTAMAEDLNIPQKIKNLSADINLIMSTTELLKQKQIAIRSCCAERTSDKT